MGRQKEEKAQRGQTEPRGDREKKDREAKR